MTVEQQIKQACNSQPSLNEREFLVKSLANAIGEALDLSARTPRDELH